MGYNRDTSFKRYAVAVWEHLEDEPMYLDFDRFVPKKVQLDQSTLFVSQDAAMISARTVYTAFKRVVVWEINCEMNPYFMGVVP